MRIIAGKFRGRNLKSPPSLDFRPTSDRLRETLFNVISPRINNAVFLDLCAGSGAVGIEALSRGARRATFVDRSKKMQRLIESNVELCSIPADDADVVRSEANDFLNRSIRNNDDCRWDIVFFDPPYAADYLQVLEKFGAKSTKLLSGDGLVIVEHHHKKELPEEVGSLRRKRMLKQGDSALSFYEPNNRINERG